MDVLVCRQVASGHLSQVARLVFLHSQARQVSGISDLLPFMLLLALSCERGKLRFALPASSFQLILKAELRLPSVLLSIDKSVCSQRPVHSFFKSHLYFLGQLLIRFHPSEVTWWADMLPTLRRFTNDLETLCAYIPAAAFYDLQMTGLVVLYLLDMQTVPDSLRTLPAYHASLGSDLMPNKLDDEHRRFLADGLLQPEFEPAVDLIGCSTCAQGVAGLCEAASQYVLCGACRIVSYCSHDCATLHWHAHSQACEAHIENKRRWREEGEGKKRMKKGGNGVCTVEQDHGCRLSQQVAVQLALSEYRTSD